MDELLEQFLIEGRELVGRATADLAALERDPVAPGRIESAFRAIHTLKGSAGIFNLAPMGAALHAAEDLLGAVRGGRENMTPSVCRGLLDCIDQCDRWIDALENLGALPADAAKEAVRIANALSAFGSGSDASSIAPLDQAPLWLERLLERERPLIAEAAAAGTPLVAVRYAPRSDYFFSGDDPLALIASIPELLALSIEAREPWPPLEEFDPFQCNLLVEALSSATRGEVQQPFRFIADQVELTEIAPSSTGHEAPETSEAARPRDPSGTRTMRVESARIDSLVDLVGELVVAKNGLSHLAAEIEAGTDPRAVAAAIRASQAATDRIVADLHRQLMGVRMVALDGSFRRLPRLVREIAARLSRDILFEVKGGDTEVDKAIADALFEPLLHMLRNAIDHGIEPPAARVSAGKPPAGRIVLAAKSLGDQVLVEVSDDGAGIDPDAIRKVAQQRGLIGAEAALDDEAAIQLVFAPGFSTAEHVSDVSGRGVGMDAVRTAIERVGGRIALASRRGHGTTFSLRLPATAALTTILLVGVAGQKFAIPLELIVETARVPEDRILPIGLGKAFVLRNRTIPLLDLAQLIGLAMRPRAREVHVLLVDGGEGVVGLAVDSFSERMNIMLRPLTGLLTGIKGVSGTTLLGDGSVLLILDLPEVIG